MLLTNSDKLAFLQAHEATRNPHRLEHRPRKDICFLHLAMDSDGRRPDSPCNLLLRDGQQDQRYSQL